MTDKRLEDIRQRAKDAYDPKMGYAFTQRPSWNDVNYLLHLLDASEEHGQNCVCDDCVFPPVETML